MRLTDIMSGLQLAIFPILALPLFLGVFVAVVVRISRRKRSAEMQHAGTLPLEEGTLVTTNRTTPSQEVTP